MGVTHCACRRCKKSRLSWWAVYITSWGSSWVLMVTRAVSWLAGLDGGRRQLVMDGWRVVVAC